MSLFPDMLVTVIVPISVDMDMPKLRKLKYYAILCNFFNDCVKKQNSPVEGLCMLPLRLQCRYPQCLTSVFVTEKEGGSIFAFSEALRSLLVIHCMSPNFMLFFKGLHYKTPFAGTQHFK